MHPFLLLSIALMIPVIVTITVFVPAYFSVLLAINIQYGERAWDLTWDFFSTVRVYRQMIEYWQQNQAQLDLVDFTLPTLGIPALGALISVFLTYRLVMYVRNIFILTTP